MKFNFDYEQRVKAFFLFDIIFLASGLASIGIGIWLYVDRNTFIELTPTSYSAFSAAGLCCFTGATISIISIVGIIGIWLRNPILLLTFVAFVTLLGALQAITGIVGLVHKEGASEYVRNDLLRNVNNSYVLTSTGRKMELSYSWGQLQQTLKCCGVDGPSDWYFSIYHPKNEFVIDSCCDRDYFTSRDAMENCGRLKKEDLHIYDRGCYIVFVNWLFHHIRVVNFLSVALIVVEFLVLPAAIFVYMEMRSLDRKSRTSREQDRRNRLIAINERERLELQLTPLDRVGDANWTENENEDSVPDDPKL